MSVEGRLTWIEDVGEGWGLGFGSSGLGLGASVFGLGSWGVAASLTIQAGLRIGPACTVHPALTAC